MDRASTTMRRRSSAALELVDITQSFGALVALSDISLSIAPGERHAVLGANGAGKTTLFNVISGDHRPTKGRVRIFGEDITDLAPQDRVRRGLRRTYQKTLLFTHLSVRDNLYLAARGADGGHFSLMRPKRSDPALLSADDLIHEVGLEDSADKPVADLAYGEQRQLEIGMALAGAPRLILFDEPAAGLSSIERKRLIGILQSLPDDLGFLVIEHDLDVALRVADRVTILHNGTMLTQGTPAEIENNKQVQQIYLGERHD